MGPVLVIIFDGIVRRIRTEPSEKSGQAMDKPKNRPPGFEVCL